MSRVYLLALTALLACARAYKVVTAVTGELGDPLNVRCLESEHPTLYVAWYRGHGKAKLLHHGSVYEMRRNTLLIKSLAVETLGEYTCQAYSSYSMEAPRMINVQAYMPHRLINNTEWIVPRDTAALRPETTSTSTSTTTGAPGLLATDELAEEVAAPEGGTAMLRCLFDSTTLHGGSSPRVTWKRGELQIDGNAGRYRLKSDGALEIVSLYRNDTGVYICGADNNLEQTRHEIHLIVNDPVRMPAGIAGDENGVVTGELGQPLHVRCLAYGYPHPSVSWYRGNGEDMALNNDAIYEVTDNILLIKSLSIEAFGQYTCRASNGEGQVASWSMVIDNELWLPRDTAPSRPSPLPSVTTNIWRFTETSTTTKLSEITKETPEAFAASEGSRTSGGTSGIIGTTSLDSCSGFQFGCCFDNKTEASGPGGQGCPCNATESGCSPDGVSPEASTTTELTDIKTETTGPFETSEGSKTSDGTTDLIGTSSVRSGFQFGCCADNETKTSGLDGQRCPCNATESGCFPDGVSPGCGCQSSLHGCCPDNVTIAQGPDNLGCGCQYTQHGCCPDRLTAALGPNYQGCACNTHQFGCCPDNVTIAKGPDQQGCHCRESKFGCCGDGETPATGPNTAGCDCSSSRHGCCPDGRTDAAGPMLFGCTHAPEDKQETSTSALIETTTETIESSETIEGSTTSEATIDVISTTTMDPCSSFEFGCCADHETEALGPNGQGCPCNTTEFGCSPEGVSPALSLRNEGCPGPCSTTPHGCCQDGKTPAHGPEFEGCCLLQAFGCCPDNRKPAEGPHLEGCGCHYALHGCCPDNDTIAQGPDNLGCGCQYTQHGCCPDRLTAASGPNNEGCACSTHQFGCCADGVTIAKGPDQQGCHCRESKFGCCGDGETPATGPDAAGCDCSSSRHGCCPDGRADAAGPKFLGCTDAPENKQAACSMPTNPGPCHNFTATWFYDMEYGGCSRFWYGGCDGNGNRFATKEECEDVCVQPSPKDACKLPSVKGACGADHMRWHYNSTREQCIPFIYGGCLGNSNNFESHELCQKQCEPSSVTGQCDLPIDQGSCAGNFSRWGFKSEAHRCEQFIWGGCEGNSNRFSSEAACQMRCAGTQPPQCTQLQEAGNCTEKEALWSFSQSENRCLPFFYSGCGGNDNRFGSREACEKACPSVYVPDKCTLPYKTGECSNYRERWFYDTTFKRCRQFYYGGCGGNENNFATEADCDSSCSEVKTNTTTTTTVRPVEPQPQPKSPDDQEPRPSAPEKSEFCFDVIDAGPCNNTETRYAYDSKRGRCVIFQYGGCGGNQNNFPDEAYCSYYCQPMQDICQLPMLQGPCEDSLMRWFYDPTTDSCSQFTYGGCEGNDNRFESLEACENRCWTGSAPVAPTTPSTTAIVNGPPECRVAESLEECRYGGVVWYFEPSRGECVSHANQKAGTLCRYTGTFPSEEACERSCGAFLGVDVCKQRMDPGPCQSYITKFYFEPSCGQCHEFSYGGCQGGANRFSTIEECSQVCKANRDPCSLPPEGGNCLSSIRQWYYDPPSGQCHQFVYTGCSGNDNRFGTQSDCEAVCKRPGSTSTTVATLPQQQAESECKTPSSLAPCGNNVTVFYYDSERGQCFVSGFGGCGHPNTYSSEEECERTCGAFRGMDVCGAHLDPGPCRASIPKIYWDAMTGSCQPYAYGGCAGGPNRFSSDEECMNVCDDTGLVVKAGACPMDETTTKEVTCRHECVDDVDCRGVGKCCRRGCSSICLVPVEQTSPHPQLTTTIAPNVPAAPQALPQQEPEVEASEGGAATLRCLFHGNPPPKITWSFGELTIDGNAGRYWIMSDGALEIVSLYRNDTGVYICVADNGLGEARQEIHLLVNDPVRTPVAIAGDENAAVTGELGQPLYVRCLAYGYPPPSVFWYHGYEGVMVPYSDSVFDTRGNVLLIRSLAIETLGEYTCQVYNGEGKAASWVVLVRAYKPEMMVIESEFLISRDTLEPRPRTQAPTTGETTTTTTSTTTTTETPRPLFTDPVKMPAGIAGDENAVVTGELDQPLYVSCLAYGYPPPSVAWYHNDGMVPYINTVYLARGNVLLIRSLTIETLGEYTCEAYNGEGNVASWVVLVRAYKPEMMLIESKFLISRDTLEPRPRTQAPTTGETPTTTTSTTTTTETPRPLFTVPVSTRVSTPSSKLNIGIDLRLACEVDGFPEPDVHWTKDGANIQTDDRITITGTIVSRLTVTRVTVADSGLYACHASNAYSSQSDTAQINVQQIIVPDKCTDNSVFAHCDVIVRSHFCRHKYYSKFCCKSCVEAGLLDPLEPALQADQPLKKK